VAQDKEPIDDFGGDPVHVIQGSCIRISNLDSGTLDHILIVPGLGSGSRRTSMVYVRWTVYTTSSDHPFYSL